MRSDWTRDSDWPGGRGESNDDDGNDGDDDDDAAADELGMRTPAVSGRPGESD
jgi:hypothetical protein